MNKDFFEKMRTRTSCRSYDETKPIEKEKIELLKETINSAPTANNLHNFSCIFLTDSNLKKEFVSYSKFQDHIVSAPLLVLFLADNNRTKLASEKLEFQYRNKIDSELYTTSIIDASLASGMLQGAAQSLGLETCWIAVLRRYPKHIMDKLNITGDAVPVLGMTIGYKKNGAEVKPKLNKVFDNYYDYDKLVSEIETYSETIKKYYELRYTNKKCSSWFDTVAAVFNGDLSVYDDYQAIIKLMYNL